MNDDPTRLSATAARFRSWIFDQALPFWAREGRTRRVSASTRRCGLTASPPTVRINLWHQGSSFSSRIWVSSLASIRYRSAISFVNVRTWPGSLQRHDEVKIKHNKPLSHGEVEKIQKVDEGTLPRRPGPGCGPVNTHRVAAGVNLALGGGSQAGQSINVQGQRGSLATTTFTRGVNLSVGAGSVAAQRIQNLTAR
jgi:hypothetical protein